MTIKQLYDLAVENGCEKYDLYKYDEESDNAYEVEGLETINHKSNLVII